ncbi:15329_t:CDS:10, partial [Funneliformis geosporum]
IASYNFPFQPYDIQFEFMKNLYQVIERGKVGIFESPTGTVHNEERYEIVEYSSNTRMETNEPSWIREKEKLERQKASCQTVDDYDMEEYLVEEYHSDDETENHEENDNISLQVKELLKSLENFDNDKETRKQDEEEPDEIKIFYCSRTHSQLTQFVNELRKTVYAEDVKCVSLGSRKNLCINDEVSKLKSMNRINEKCLDMQKAGIDKIKNDFVTASVRDIEELADIGRELGACPYYGTRKSIRRCQIVTLPYSLLLQKSSRESMKILLKDNIVIIDEVHNLVDTVTSVHTIIIDLPQIVNVRSQLNAYLDRYKKRLLGKNVMYIQQILSLLDALIRCLTAFEKKCEEKGKDKERMNYIKTVNDFLHILKIGDLNLFKIENYLKKSQVARKLNGFVDKIESRTSVEIHQMQQTKTFLMSLTNGNQDGRVILGFQQIIDPIEGKREMTIKYIPYIKYLLLNPSSQFEDIVEEVRRVILAGGTMEPIDDLIEQLFPYLPTLKSSKFSCGHIVPPENLLTLTLSEGPIGGTFEFTFERHDNIKLIDELGQTIINLCNVIPDGVVFQEPRETQLVEK